MKALSALLFLLCASLTAQEFTVRVVKADGEVQIRREEDRKWSKLRKNTPVQDNDVIQTSFKSACEIRAGAENVLFMGSNSRMLVNISEKSDGTAEVAVTVFSGSVYSKVISRLKYLVYSSTAMARAEKAVFNCTVDEVSGMAGFHVFSGEITVTNISIQGEQTVKPGDMTTVPPDAPPSQPGRINARQMSVLTRFYGADFINQEIEASGIEIVSSPSVTAKTESGASAEQKKESRAESASPAGGGKKTLRLFDADALIRRLDRYEAEHEWVYSRPVRTETLAGRRYRGTLVASPVQFNGKLYPDVFLRPGIFTENWSVALNLGLAADSAGKPTVNVQGARGALDKIYSAEYRFRKHYARLGEISGYTVGAGGLMKNYSNQAFSDNLRNTGLFLHYESYLIRTDAFTSSLADFHLSGANFYIQDTSVYLGAAIFRENGQKMNLNGGDLGWRAGAAGALPDSAAPGTPVSLIYPELDGAVYLANERSLKSTLYGSVYGVLWNEEANLKGWGFTFPGFELLLGKYGFSAEIYLGKGYMVRRLFNPFYEDNLFLVSRNSESAPESVQTMQGATLKSPVHSGLGFSLKAEPLKGLAFSAEWEKTMVYFVKDTLGRINSESGPRSGMLDIRIIAGKGLYRRLPWAEAYFSNYLCGYFAQGAFSPFTPNTFTGMGGRVHFLAMNNLECFAGVERYFYDVNGDWRAETSSEGVMRITAGATMGF